MENCDTVNDHSKYLFRLYSLHFYIKFEAMNATQQVISNSFQLNKETIRIRSDITNLVAYQLQVVMKGGNILDTEYLHIVAIL